MFFLNFLFVIFNGNAVVLIEIQEKTLRGWDLNIECWKVNKEYFKLTGRLSRVDFDCYTLRTKCAPRNLVGQKRNCIS